MISLSRTVSHESNGRSKKDLPDLLKSQKDPGSTTVIEPNDPSSPSLPSSNGREVGPPRLKSRTTSRSLLPSNSISATANRKGRSAEAGLINGGIDRASISMPPPTTKPSAHNKPPAPRCTSTALNEERHPNSKAVMTGNESEGAAEGSAVLDDTEKPPNVGGTELHPASSSYSPIVLADAALRPPPKTRSTSIDSDNKRLSFSSLYSMGSAIYNGAIAVSGNRSTPSSNAGSMRSGAAEPPNPPVGQLSPSLSSSTKADTISSITTATDPISVTTLSHTPNPGSISPPVQPISYGANAAAKHLESWSPGTLPRMPPTRRSRSRTQRQPSDSTIASSSSPGNGDRGSQGRPSPIGRIGVCALDVKARSKPSRNILTRLQNNGEFEVVVFGDKVILDEGVENWPLCDFLISFFSDGFPLDKAIAYAQLRKPFCVNDLPMQKVLWDRRICLRILDSMGVPTPRRVEVNRDGGPTLESAELAHHVYHMSGVRLDGPEDGTGGGMKNANSVALIDDGDTLLVDGVTFKKPFVEKPVCGEDHNICIYYPKSQNGGGGRKLFRKIGNKSSEWDSNLTIPRAVTEEGSSYVYEQFLHVDNAEDVKAYTVGPDFCHAETRKSPVVDGLVRRNTHGKEIRYITSLTKEEAIMASKITEGFGQRICGFDLLRVGTKSYVIDVNGWSFVKDNNEYYDKCSTILKQMFIKEKRLREGYIPEPGLDMTVSARKSTSNHRQAFKNLFKSPSLTRLAGAHHGNRIPGTQSPDWLVSTPPLTSPPSLEKRQSVSHPSIPILKDTELLSPLAPGTRPDPSEPQTARSGDYTPSTFTPLPASKHSWKLKGMVAVIRHADRTPKQKYKFTFHTQPFVDLLKGHQEEVLLKGEAALGSVLEAVKKATQEGIEDQVKLGILRSSLARKGAWTGTKVQIKPMFRKREPKRSPNPHNAESEIKSKGDPSAEMESGIADSQDHTRSPTRSDSLAGVTLSRFSAVENDLVLDKLQLIIKWGGEPTHAARYQSQDLGENMRNDLLLMNREALEDVRVFTSSERRVSTSAQIWASSFLAKQDLPDDFISVRKDLLDDSNAAKDVMDKVKKKLKLLMREGHEAPPQFAWPANTPEPYLVVQRVAELMRFHRQVMRHNYVKVGGGAAASLSALNHPGEGTVPSSPGGTRALGQPQSVASIQAKWCCGEDAELFKERWEKLFNEFTDSEKVDPSKISELYDTMKFDALHNRQFLEWIFTPSAGLLEEDEAVEVTGKSPSGNLAQRMGFRRKNTITNALSSISNGQGGEENESYFKLFGSGGQSKVKQDVRLEKLRELYKLAKVLFDFVCPQEYGIDDSEKLEIGLLTSLPLLKEIVKDLEEVQAAEDAKSFIYFTKESHIYTLLNCILEGGIKTKIARNAIPELDYLSQICFELYESEDKEADTFAYSIRITITPGCHTSDPLDVQLDSKHSIGCAPRRSLTAHANWKEVTETLRAKFDTVKLPKSFLAINLSERHAREADKDDTQEMAR